MAWHELYKGILPGSIVIVDFKMSSGQPTKRVNQIYLFHYTDASETTRNETLICSFHWQWWQKVNYKVALFQITSKWPYFRPQKAPNTSKLYVARCQAGPFSWGRPMALFIYIFITWFCAASAECRASSDVAICRSVSQSVSQSVFNSRRDQSTPVVAEFGRSLAAGRYVAVANKVLIL